MNYITIGDVHLGKKFKSKDIPLDKRGIREQLLVARFNQLVDKAIENKNALGVIQLGDLFDSFCVSYEDLIQAYQILKKFEDNKVRCYILAGNHDISKDSQRISAFSILKKLFQRTLGTSRYVFFIEGSPYAMISPSNERILLVPYIHGKTAAEILSSEVNPVYSTTVYGHFEESDFDWLKHHFNQIYTGHIHLPRKEGNLTVVGSIMPFTFAEDVTNTFMKTCTLQEYEADYVKGLTSGRCYRIKLKEGESLPADTDCLQLSEYKQKPDELQEADLNVDFEVFDIEKLLHEALDDLGLFLEIHKIYSELKMAEIENV